MKIGILTLPLHTNYGGILQAYALQTILERFGHSVVVVDKDRFKPSDPYHQIRSLLGYIKSGFSGSNKPNWIYNNEKRKREVYTRAFINKYIKIYSVKLMDKEFPDDVDAIVVGSDQIWRKTLYCGMIGGDIEDAYLAFTNNRNIKRIAYAASFGTDEWEYSYEETKRCRTQIKKFDAVSIREANGVELCKYQLGRKDAKHVLDPTLLLEKKDYETLVNSSGVPASAGNLMVYILDDTEEKKMIVDRIASERKLKPFRTNQSDDVIRENPKVVQPPLEEWLRGFMDAKFVVTDSFHACVFSIIFGKPFVAVGNKKRGLSRFTSLLDTFGLTDNLIFSIEDYRPEYSYGITLASQNVIEAKREESLNFLIENLR